MLKMKDLNQSNFIINTTTSNLIVNAVENTTFLDLVTRIESNLQNITLIDKGGVSVTVDNIKDESSNQFAVVNIIKKWVILVPVLLGLILNGLCITVMRRPLVRESVISIYLIFLACIDSVFLIVYPLRILKIYTEYPIHHVPCIILKFLRTFSFGLSSWIITIVAIERSLVVLFPFRANKHSNKKKAKITIFIIFIINVLISSPDIITYVDLNKKIECKVTSFFRFYEVNIRFTLVGILTSYLPFTIIVVCNVLLVWKIMAAKKARRSLSGISEKATGYDVTKLTTVAVVMCLTFLFLTAPSMVFFLLDKIYHWKSYEAGIIRSLAPLLALIRAAVNGFLCICCSRTLRGEMMKMIRRKTKETPELTTSYGTHQESVTTHL